MQGNEGLDRRCNGGEQVRRERGVGGWGKSTQSHPSWSAEGEEAIAESQDSDKALVGAERRIRGQLVERSNAVRIAKDFISGVARRWGKRETAGDGRPNWPKGTTGCWGKACRLA